METPSQPGPPKWRINIGMSPKGLVCAFLCLASMDIFLRIQEALTSVGASKLAEHYSPFGCICEFIVGTAEIVVAFESDEYPIIMYAKSNADDEVVRDIAKALERASYVEHVDLPLV